MQAVVSIGGKQFIIEPGQEVRVPSRSEEIGASINLSPVLMVSSEDQVTLSPKDLVAKAHVIEHGLDKKIRVFKHHAKKRYRRTYGHRQGFTVIKIEAIEAA